jgi:hypothetical protein
LHHPLGHSHHQLSHHQIITAGTMKSATLSAGLVAALLCPTSVIAGEPKCPKTARGTNRVTCFLEVEHTDIIPEKDGHHKRGHKHKDIETSRTIKVYAWSFFWNYIIKDDCPKTTAYLTSVLPSLGNHHHGVKCKVEVRWTPDNHKGHYDDKDQYYDQYHNTPWNVSWDYAGDGQIDWFSMPAKMVWPLPASFHRPDDYTKSHELGVKYELANHDDMTTLDVSLSRFSPTLDMTDDALLDSQWQRQRLFEFLGPWKALVRWAQEQWPRKQQQPQARTQGEGGRGPRGTQGPRPLYRALQHQGPPFLLGL